MHGSADHPEPPVRREEVGAPHEPPAHEAPGSRKTETETETAGPEAAAPADGTTMVFRPAPDSETVAAAEPRPPESSAVAQPGSAAPPTIAEVAPPEPTTVVEVAPPQSDPGPEPSQSAVAEPEPVAQAAQLTEPLAIHHIGVAVSSIDQAMQFYGEKLGLSVVSRVTMPERSLKVAFVRTGNTLIELLEPTNDASTVARFIERRGPGLHHLCFGTPDIAEHLRDLKDKGVELIDETPRPGGLGSVAFIQPSAAHGVLVELLQERLPDAEAPY